VALALYALPIRSAVGTVPSPCRGHHRARVGGSLCDYLGGRASSKSAGRRLVVETSGLEPPTPCLQSTMAFALCKRASQAGVVRAQMAQLSPVIGPADAPCLVGRPLAPVPSEGGPAGLRPRPRRRGPTNEPPAMPRWNDEGLCSGGRADGSRFGWLWWFRVEVAGQSHTFDSNND
jgi:hypothetical protein